MVGSRRPHSRPTAPTAAESISRLAGSPGALQLCEEALVFVEHDVPAVVIADVFPPVGTHCGAQRLITDEQLQALYEFVAVGIVQPAIAGHAVLDEHRASCID